LKKRVQGGMGGGGGSQKGSVNILSLKTSDNEPIEEVTREGKRERRN